MYLERMKRNLKRVRRGAGVAFADGAGNAKAPYLKRILPAALFWFAFALVILLSKLGQMAYDGDLRADRMLLLRTAIFVVFAIAVSFAISAWIEWSDAGSGGGKR